MKRTFTLLWALSLVSSTTIFAQINFTILNKPVSYAVNLDSMARTGTSAIMPLGWHLYQSNGRQIYRANVGDSANANVYSYGAATGVQSRIRALGSISSAKDTCYFGAEFVNNTGYAINTLTIAYTIEQWHLGAKGRGADTTEFDLSTNAISLTGTGTWVNYSYLDMISPVTTGTVGALNGNLPANQSKVSFKITGLNIANGAHYWIRWYDHVIKGLNDGLGLQALTLTAYSIAAGPTVVTKINEGKFPQIAGIPDTTVYGKFHGIVLSPNFYLPLTKGLRFSIRDTTVNTGVLAGIGAITCMASTDLNGYTPEIGDSIYVTGKIRSIGYLTYLQIDTLKLIKAVAHPSPPPILANGISDNNESNLITINNLTLTPTANWDTTGSYQIGGFVTTARTTTGANFTIFINKNSDIFLKPKPNFPFNLTGIAQQFSTTANVGYFIWPRFTKDFDTLPQPKLPLKKIGDITDFYNNAMLPQFYGHADSLNKKYFIKGVVHSPNLFYEGLYFNVIDNTGAITVYNVTPVGKYNPQVGDSVMVRGTILQLNGLIVMVTDSIKLLSKNAPLTFPQMALAAITKNQESYLISLQAVKIIDPINWDSTKLNTLKMFEVRVANGPDTFYMDIAKTTDLFRKPAINGVFRVTGVVGENAPFTSKTPYNGHYTVIPRGSFDISQSKIQTYKIGQIKPYNSTTGVADSIGVTCYTKGVVQSGNINDTGAMVFGIADNTGAITVANLNKLTGYPPAIGDSINLLGTLTQVSGLTVFIPDSIHILNVGNNTITPVVLSKLDEKNESGLITVHGYTMADPNEWDNKLTANKYGFNLHFYKGTDTLIVHISDNVPDLFNLPYAQKPLGIIDITGLELQKTVLAKAPFANYYIVPRMLSDLGLNFTGIGQLYSTENNINVYPNPAQSQIQITSASNIEKIILSDMEGKALKTIFNPQTLNASIDLSSIKQGIYVLQINNASGISIQKMIRQ